MEWTQTYVDMIKEADIKIDDEYVLFVNRDGKVGSPALEILRDAVIRKSGVLVTCLSVWQKCYRLRKEKHVADAAPKSSVVKRSSLCSLAASCLVSPFPAASRKRAASPERNATPQVEQKRMRLWVETPPASPSSEKDLPVLEIQVLTAIPMLRDGLPDMAVKQKLSGKSWEEYLTAEAHVAQNKYSDNRDLRAPTPPLFTYAAILLHDLPLPSPLEASAEVSAKDNSGLSQYEKDRLARIERNKELMRAVGIFQPTSATESAANSAAKPRRPHNKIPKGRPAERQKSERTQGKVVNYKELDRSRSPSPGPAETEHAGSPLPETHGEEQRCSSPELPSFLCKRLRDKSSK